MEQNEVLKEQKNLLIMNEVPRKTTCTKKKNSSLKINEFSLRNGPSSLGRKVTSPRSNRLSPKNNHVSNRFVITTISCSFLYKFMTYHWKDVEKGYNFVVESTSIIICIKNIYITNLEP